MGYKRQGATKRKAFLMRVEGHSMAEVMRQLKVSQGTLSKWENGYIDSKGRRYKGWKEDLERKAKELEEAELEKGLMVKRERLKAYDELARMAIDTVKKNFPNIELKNASDAKALLSEIRELNRLIAIEKGEYQPGNQTVIAVKTDISLTELQERYKNVQGHSKKDTD